MKYRLRQFFTGRNGFDQLSKIIIWPALILYLVSNFVGVQWLQYVLHYVSLTAMIYVLFRAFSRKLDKRQAENAAYLAWREKQKRNWKFKWRRHQERKTYCYFTCPDCNTKLRVPKGKGRIRITCQRCGKCFEKRT